MNERECAKVVRDIVMSQDPAIQAQIKHLCDRIVELGTEYHPIVFPLGLALLGSLYQLEVAKRDAAGGN